MQFHDLLNNILDSIFYHMVLFLAKRKRQNSIIQENKKFVKMLNIIKYIDLEPAKLKKITRINSKYYSKYYKKGE